MVSMCLLASGLRDNRSRPGDHGVVARQVKGSQMKGESGDLLSVLALGEHNVDVLADGRALGSLARAVLKHAQDGGADVLVAASPSVERLVGAVLMLAPDTLRGLRSAESLSRERCRPRDRRQLASGTSMATTARQVRRQGAQRVLGAVMHFLADNVPTARDCGLDLLSVFGSPATPADLPL